jgi:hypothetical protein
MIVAIVGVIYAFVIVVIWHFVTRWQFRSYRSMLEMSISSRYAGRGEPRSKPFSEFGAGTLNCSGRPFSVSLTTDHKNLYLVARPHWAIHNGMPSYVIPLADVHSAERMGDLATLRLATGSVTLKRYRGVSPEIAITQGADGIDQAEVAAQLHPPHPEGSLHLGHIFNPLRIVAGVALLLLGISSALAGHWEIMAGFAIGGLLVLGVLGRLIARAAINPEANKSISQMSGATLAISGVTSMAPLAIAGSLVLLLAKNDGFLEVLAGACLSAAFSMLILYVGFGITRAHVVAKGVQAK